MATATRLAGREAIEAFVAAGRAGEGVRVYSYSPNGGFGGPAGSNGWGSEDWVREILQAEVRHLDPETAEYEYDPATRTLEVRDTPGRGVHQYYTLSYAETPDLGRRRVAYYGAHAGLNWEDGEWEAVGSEALEALLRDLMWDDEALAEFGLASCEDYECGDDGGFWLVADKGVFAEVARKCRDLSERYDDLDADDVRAYVLHGTEPEADD